MEKLAEPRVVDGHREAEGPVPEVAVDDVRASRQPPRRKPDPKHARQRPAQRYLEVVARRDEVQRVVVGAELELHAQSHRESLDHTSAGVDRLHRANLDSPMWEA